MLRVTLPLLRPALLAAASITFLFTFTSFGIIRILGGPRHPTIEVEIWRLTTQAFELRAAAALAFLQLVAVTGLMLWWSNVQARQAVTLRLRPRGTAASPRTARQRALVASTVAGLVAIVVIPLGRLVAGSLRGGDGLGLSAWRALGSRSRPGTRQPSGRRPAGRRRHLAALRRAGDRRRRRHRRERGASPSPPPAGAARSSTPA